MKRIAYLMATVILVACLADPEAAVATLLVAGPGALALYGALCYLARRCQRDLDAEHAAALRARQERAARERRLHAYLGREGTP